MPATGPADNTIAFTFDNKRAPVDVAAIQAEIDKVSGTAEGAPEAATPPAEPAAAAAKPAEAAALATAPAVDLTSQPKPVEEGLKTYKITVDGQEMEVTEADLKAGHMRHRDYTQKTQRLSAREKELDAIKKTWEDEIAARDKALQQLDIFLKDPRAIDAYVKKAFAAEQAPPLQLDPNKPVTLEDVAKIAAYNAEQVRLSTIRDTRAEVEKANEAANRALNQLNAANREKVENEVDRHLASVLDKFPVLREASENIEDELMGDASRFLPQGSTLEDAKLRLSEAAERRAARIQAITEKAKKAAAIAAAEVKRSSAEPAGGSAPKPVAPRKLTLDPKDRNARLAAAQADVEAFMQSGQLP